MDCSEIVTSPHLTGFCLSLFRTQSGHVVHAPVPCRHQPIKGSPISLAWSSPPGPSLQPSAKPILPQFPNLTAAGKNDSHQDPGYGSLWHKQSISKPNVTEPTVLFRLRSLSGHMEMQTKTQEIKENQASKVERASGDRSREMYEGPLDLSDHGKTKTNQSPTDYTPVALKKTEKAHNSTDKNVKTTPSTHGPLSSFHCIIPPSSSPDPLVKNHEEESGSDRKTKVFSDLSGRN